MTLSKDNSTRRRLLPTHTEGKAGCMFVEHHSFKDRGSSQPVLTLTRDCLTKRDAWRRLNKEALHDWPGMFELNDGG